MKMLDIKYNLSQIRYQIAQVSEQFSRNSEDICLVAVSKTKPVELILEAYDCGQLHFAENYLQEATEKIKFFSKHHPQKNSEITWHFIGHIQSNKCREIAHHFSWVHSLVSLKHAQRLNRFRENIAKPLNICIQVEIETQDHRNGIPLTEAHELVHRLKDLKNLKIRGLMCVLPLNWTNDQATIGFQLVKNEYDQLKQHFPEIDTLSIGMSNDFKQAIQAGSTLLRLGSSIFGARL